MHWGQIKTLFILCFLLLDIYLLFLVLEKQEVEVLDRPQDISIEQQLKSENITIDAELPKNQPDEAFISIQQKRLTEEEYNLLDKLENQEYAVIDNNLITSKFESPIAIPEDANEDVINTLVRSNVIYPGDYEFDSWNEQLNILVFFQKRNGRSVYYNQNGIILVYLNDADEMVAYTQTILGEPNIRNEKNSLIKPITALDTLYDNNQLVWGEVVTDIEMGYHMTLPLDNGVHILVPTWKVTINGEKNRYVNAVENFVFPVDDQEILIEATELNIEKIRTLDESENIEFETKIIQLLTSKIEAVNRSEKP